MRPSWGVVRGGRFLFAPREARLQFALLPSITGEGFLHACMAASGSLNVTFFKKKERDTLYCHVPHYKTRKRNKQKQTKCTYKAIALGSSSVFIYDNNSFKNISKLLKISPQCIPLSLPSKSSHEDFCHCCVIIIVIINININILPMLLRHYHHDTTQT